MRGMEAGTTRAAVKADAYPRRVLRIAVGESGEPVDLLAGRAAFLPQRGTLVVADLHLGKSETFRAAGAPIPDGVHAADLRRLGALIDEVGASRLLILGDLLHAGIGVTGRLIDEVGAWRAARARLTIDIVPGNHDGALDDVAGPWGLGVLPRRHAEGEFEFCHAPQPGRGFGWCGHVHPLVWVGPRRSGLSLPCFWLSPSLLVLPAFGTFTRGVLVDRGRGDRVFAAADGHLFEA